MRIGTCSWKYESWRGIVYPDFGEFDFLEEYSKHYNTVEIDQWFWSLIKDKAYLPKPKSVNEYNEATPDDFKFTIKMPNSLTLTHPYKSTTPNPYFLSPELMKSFIHSIEPIIDKVGVLMFQFEYLNKNKMHSLKEFIHKFQQLVKTVDKSIQIGIEIRNSNYLKKEYFQFLKENKIAHVFLQGYFMPNITEVYNNFKELLHDTTVIRLHSYDRKGIEAEENNNWNNIYQSKDDELPSIIKMINSLNSKDSNLYLNVNNHYEGSAPLTINKIKNSLQTDLHLS
jgi:uncharacterized protein YecE (DUF72 family)